MGNQESSSVKSTEQTKDNLNQVSDERGHIVSNEFVEANISEVDSEDSSSLAETGSDSDSDDEVEDEDYEELMERLRILEDAKKLKQLAVAFLHPEKPVEVDGTACARCYFDRPSAPEQERAGETEYRNAVLEDTAALKRLAVDYMHPEVSVQLSDPTATARCYFDRPCAPEQESMEEAEQRAMILEDAKKLRKAALEYLHPELGVVTTDPTAAARCFFDRLSAPEQESMEEAEERRMVLEEAAALKKLAIDYIHPEIGVVTTDPAATARCYFDRPSAPEQESVGEAEGRCMVLEEAAALKKLAVDYMHPEIGVVTTDPAATARCYFDRPSANLEAESASLSQSKETELQVQPKVETVPVPVVKDVGVKAVEAKLEGIIRKSASAVQLYGLDDDHGDDTF